MQGRPPQETCLPCTTPFFVPQSLHHGAGIFLFRHPPCRVGQGGPTLEDGRKQFNQEIQTKMPKKAFLVTFVPQTRVIFDVPEGFNPGGDDDSSDKILVKILDKARAQMDAQLDGYLNADNLESCEEDTECPYGTFEGDEL